MLASPKTLLFSLLLILCTFNKLFIEAAKDEKKKVYISNEVDKLITELVARYTCYVTSGVDNQLIYPKTIGKVIKYFEDLVPDETDKSREDLIKCREKYLPSIVRLNELIQTGNEDVCDGKKISLIERYHFDYISQNSRSSEQGDQAKSEAPLLMRLFFMHYVTEVSTICARSADVKLSVSGIDPELEKEMESTENRLGAILNLFEPNKGYKSMFMPWTLIDSLSLSNNKMISKFLPSGEKRLFVKMREAKKFKEVQSLCKFVLKPYYSRTLSPVLRLIDLGYYPDNKPFELELKSNEKWRTLYKMTVTCETILPIAVIESFELPRGESVLLTVDEAERIMKDEPELLELKKDENALIRSLDDIELEKTDNSMEKFDTIDVTNDVQMIMATVKARNSGLNQVYSLILKVLNKSLRAKIGKLFMSNVDGKKEDLQPFFEETLDRVDKSNPLGLKEETSIEFRSEKPQRQTFLGFFKDLGWFLGVIARDSFCILGMAVLGLFVVICTIISSTIKILWD